MKEKRYDFFYTPTPLRSNINGNFVNERTEKTGFFRAQHHQKQTFVSVFVVGNNQSDPLNCYHVILSELSDWLIVESHIESKKDFARTFYTVHTI